MLLISRIVFCAVTVYQFSNVESLSGSVVSARENEFPFVVSIGQKSRIYANDPYGHICGGALITWKYVLTSADCFLEDKTPSDYLVYSGSSDLSQSTINEVKSWITLDCWLSSRKHCTRPRCSSNDIALVELKVFVRHPARETLISTLPAEQLEGQNVTTAGWGLISYGSNLTQLLKGELRVIGRDEGVVPNCVETAGNCAKNIFSTNGSTSFVGLDPGDRGSPAFIDQGNGKYVIVGVNQRAMLSGTPTPYQKNEHIGVDHYIRFFSMQAHVFRFA